MSAVVNDAVNVSRKGLVRLREVVALKEQDEDAWAAGKRDFSLFVDAPKSETCILRIVSRGFGDVVA